MDATTCSKVARKVWRSRVAVVWRENNETRLLNLQFLFLPSILHISLARERESSSSVCISAKSSYNVPEEVGWREEGEEEKKESLIPAAPRFINSSSVSTENNRRYANLEEGEEE